MRKHKSGRRSSRSEVSREIRYDPANPEQARIGAGWNRRFFAVPLITSGCGLAFGLLAVGFFITARLGQVQISLADDRAHDAIGQHDRDNVLGNRDEDVFHLQAVHQSAAYVVADIRSNKSTDDAEDSSDERSRRSGSIEASAAKASHHHTDNERRNSCARRRLRKFVIDNLADGSEREDANRDGRAHERQRAIMQVDPSQMRCPTDQRRCRHRAQAGDEADSDC